MCRCVCAAKNNNDGNERVCVRLCVSVRVMDATKKQDKFARFINKISHAK